jgi:hypothetical protein
MKLDLWMAAFHFFVPRRNKWNLLVEWTILNLGSLLKMVVLLKMHLEARRGGLAKKVEQ